jgi:hypothetical protein
LSDASAYDYRRSITVNGGQVSGGPLTNFPMLVSVTDANLRAAANGGKITNPNGYDIIFQATDDATCGGAGLSPCPLDHEIEKYDGTAGQLLAWVRVPSLTSGTAIYMYYGDSGVTSPTANPPGVWEGTFKGVWHLKETTGGVGSITDSTSNANHGTPVYNPTLGVAGQIDGSTGFSGGTDHLRIENELPFDLTAATTVSAWIRVTSFTTAYQAAVTKGDSAFRLQRNNRTRYMGFHVTTPAQGVVQANGSVRVDDGGWHYLVGAFDGVSVRLYQDGVQAASQTFSATSISTNNLGVAIGENLESTGREWRGSIDEARIAATVRSAGWIATEYRNQGTPSAFYTLGAEEGTGAPTAVRMRSAVATALEDGGVLVQWETGWEWGNLGFHVYREQGSVRVRLTPELLAGSALRARGRGARLTAGHVYNWRDPEGGPGVTYWLEDVDVGGGRARHGPVPVRLGGKSPGRLARNAPFLSQVGREGDGRGRRVIHRRWGLAGRMDRAAERSAVQGVVAALAAVKLLVSDEGWYRVSQPDLVAAGLDPAVDPRTLQLFADGVEVPIRLLGASGGRFGAEAAIEFHGSGLDTPWSDTRTYWLTWGGQRGQRIPVRPAPPGAGPAPHSFPVTIERKDRVVYAAALLNGEASNFFGPLVSGEPVTLPLPTVQADPAPPADSSLEVDLQGVTEAPHRIRVQVNGLEAGVLSFTGVVPGSLRVALPAGWLRPDENAISLTAEGGELDVSLVDVIRVTYWRTYTAEGDVLRAEAPGGSRVTLDGFSDARVHVVDITDAGTPLELGGSIQTQTGTTSISVTAPGSGTRVLLAYSEAAVAAPTAILPHAPTTCHQGRGSADLLVIGPAALHQALGPLVALRQRQGLQVSVVDVQALYDAYSFGAKDPAAIRAFLLQARQRWTRPPRFVLLAGSASVDPRNYLGQGERDLLPAPLVDTALLETASDGWYADSDGTGVPALAIGRIPAQTAEEVTVVVDKLIAAEERNPAGAPAALFVADADEASDFSGMARELAGSLPSRFRTEQLSLAHQGVTSLRSSLFARMAEGVSLLSFVGHGSVGVWSAEGLLATEDIDTLAPAPDLPVVAAWTCLNGFFHDPYTESLAAALLTAEARGAVAVLASSGMTEAGAQLPLARAFNQGLAQERTLGEAFLRAKAAASDRDVRRTWLLFGDPSMPIR